MLETIGSMHSISTIQIMQIVATIQLEILHGEQTALKW